jgi:DHA2 family multidrug resistance protein-like MFS transporter
MDLTVLHLAVPSLARDLRPSSTQLLWIIDIYGFLVAGALITMGTLGDRIGRRRMLLVGAAAFGVASALAAFSTTPEMLIAARALLGLAGATVAPSTLSLIRNMFLDPDERRVAISVWIAAFSIGGAVGPFVGGVLLEFFWWGSVFLVAVPIMVLILVAGPWLLPEYRDPEAGRPDLPSAALSIGAVLAAIWGLKDTAQDGPSPASLSAILAGLALGVAFVRRQESLDDPLIDLALFRAPAFGASVAVYGLSIFVLFGGILFLPQYLQLVRGLSPLEAGLWGVPSALAWVAGAVLTPRIARLGSPSSVMATGLVCAAGGFAFFARIDASAAFWAYATASVIYSLGTAPVFTLTNELVIGSAPPERAGAAAGISETSAELGGALGIAVFGSIGVAVYRRLLAAAPLEGVPPEAVQSAMETLGGAAEVARALPPEAGETIVAAAHDAFLTGLHLCAWIATLGLLALAAFVALRFGKLALGDARAAP